MYVAHIPGIDMMSADAVGEMQQDFDEIERDLRVSAGEQLGDREERWTFERRGGLIGEALISAAKDIGAANPDGIVTIVVGQLVAGVPPRGRVGCGGPGPALTGTRHRRALAATMKLAERASSGRPATSASAASARR